MTNSNLLPKCPKTLSVLKWWGRYQNLKMHHSNFSNFQWVTPFAIKVPHLGNLFMIRPSNTPKPPSQFDPYLAYDPPFDLSLDLSVPQSSGISWEAISPFEWVYLYEGQEERHVGITLDWKVITKKCKIEIPTKDGLEVVGVGAVSLKFYMGLTVQEVGTAVANEWNTGKWHFCYSASSIPTIVDLDRWEFGAIPLIEHLKIKIEKSGLTTDSYVDLESLNNTIDRVSEFVAAAPIPRTQEEFRQEINQKLELAKADLNQAESLVRRSNGVSAETQRLELRAAAIDRLQSAHYIKNAVTRLLLQLKESISDYEIG